MKEVIEFYNKYDEDNRLKSKTHLPEYLITMKYIKKYLTPNSKILEIGAGTGRYSIALADMGYDITSVELVPHNIEILKSKIKTEHKIKVFEGNACDLSFIEDNTYDIVLLLGPMYHLFTKEDKVRALCEAKRVTKPGGIIFVAYVMNEYSILTYGFKQKHIAECVRDGRISEEFQCMSAPSDLYDYVRIEQIDALNQEAGLERIKIITPDGPANYMRQVLNSLTEEEFELFIQYHLSTCERQDLIGAAAHTVDILRK